MTDDILNQLGPLKFLAGTWEGEKGNDVAPSDDRGTEVNKFREVMTFEPFGPTDNHEQRLYGLRYGTTAWRLGEDIPFHEDRGYWLWDAKSKQVMRAFVIPRGQAVLAGATVEANAKEFTLVAELGSPTFGICSSPFLDVEFKTVKYTFKVMQLSDGRYSYESDTQIIMKGQKEVFHHTDKNILTKR